MKTGKELADQLDAEDRLRNRGFLKLTCEHCKGTGYLIPRKLGYRWCPHCDNRGFKWKAPLWR